MSRRSALALAFAFATFGVLMFLSRSVAVRGVGYGNPAFSFPERPLIQADNETEPNNSFDQANDISVSRTMAGVITPTADIDWFRLDLDSSDAGREFEATLEELVPSADYELKLELYILEAGKTDPTIVDSAQGNTAMTLDWTATEATYYFRVTAAEFPVTNAPGQEYGLTVQRQFTNPTDTPTATPVPWDVAEINDSIDGSWPGGPFQIAVGMRWEQLNFVPYTGQPVPNDDYYTFLAKAGRTYRITTGVAGGTDTEMWLYDLFNAEIAYDDDSGVGSGSQILRTLGDGWYKILVRDRLRSTSPSTTQIYDIIVEDVTPATSTPTSTAVPGVATSTPTPARIPGSPDAFEPNYDFDRASLIGLGVTYANLNFVPWTGEGVDNDFYKLWVIGGKLYTCETLELGDATNTNMILYSCPSTECGFAGNDDVQPFDANDPYRSRITFFSSYTGYLYVLLGQVGTERILPGEWASLSYKLRCFIEQPGTATPTATSPYVSPPPTAVPQETAAPAPTRAVIIVIPMTTPPPPPPSVPVPTPTPQLFVINLTLYYDRNGNGQMEADEGIVDVLARAFDAVTGELLAIDYTNQMGQLSFSVPNTRPVRLSVPYFGFDQIVTATNSSIQIRIAPQP